MKEEQKKLRIDFFSINPFDGNNVVLNDFVLQVCSRFHGNSDK